jgi:type III pantothenate kinase
MISLAIDRGNTKSKIGAFDGSVLVESVVCAHADFKDRLTDIIQLHAVNAVICSSVDRGFRLSSLPVEIQCLTLDASTPLPVRNAYQTPQTLGPDRLAAAIGAWSICPDKDLLIIDAGTCITYDILEKNGTYLGGSISPGLHARLRSLSTQTTALPDVAFRKFPALTGQNTEECILSGVWNGMNFEMRGFIDSYLTRYSDLTVFITGGDAAAFDIPPNNRIFAEPALVLKGLIAILQYNLDIHHEK